MTEKCVLCFESATGVKHNDQLVSSNNGHVFHFCCLNEYMTGPGRSTLCPVCDEDLEKQAFMPLKFLNRNKSTPLTPLPLSSQQPPPLPPRGLRNEARSIQPTAGAAVQRPSKCSWENPDYSFKIVILGDFNVGKSSLLQRYADETFYANQATTIGCDLRVQFVHVAGKRIRLNLWDTAGQERHRAIVDIYLRRADGIIFCFDITDLQSFISLRTWYEFAMQFLPDDTIKIIAGTKADLWSQRVVSSAQIQQLAESWKAQYLYTSAKDATNVEVVFRSLTALILEKRIPNNFFKPSAPLAGPSFGEGMIIKLSKSPKKQQKKKMVSKSCCE
ncbi:Ras-like GTP-binding protein YPT1 [Orchesella cincta]|uniref:Ras-like GTP-binding protein YPT1 n=1 Tax=Orchesella cincta TaxID=48709 RepID=A0A1D2NCH4_ORCCI|nr:Ras-like GTP-binding protein YPT1 [Orchesella cincta]